MILFSFFLLLRGWGEGGVIASTPPPFQGGASPPGNLPDGTSKFHSVKFLSHGTIKKENQTHTRTRTHVHTLHYRRFSCITLNVFCNAKFAYLERASGEKCLLGYFLRRKKNVLRRSFSVHRRRRPSIPDSHFRNSKTSLPSRQPSTLPHRISKIKTRSEADESFPLAVTDIAETRSSN